MIRNRRKFIPKTEHSRNTWHPLDGGDANLIQIDIHKHIAREIMLDLFRPGIHSLNANSWVVGINISHTKLTPQEILLLRFALEGIPVFHVQVAPVLTMRNGF